MKKILTHPTGIVFLLTILASVSCGNLGEQNATTNEENGPAEGVMAMNLPPTPIVMIMCKAVVADDGSLVFTMWDGEDAVTATPTNDPFKFNANLTTDVQANKIVFWRWSKNSQIKEFMKISPLRPGNIIPGEATQFDARRILMLQIPNNAETGEESYYIQFMWKDKIVTIDPHLKVPER